MADRKKVEKKIERVQIEDDFNFDDDEEFQKQLAEATSDTSHIDTSMTDEEYARKLQQEINAELSTNRPAQPTATSPSFYKPQASATYAAPPTGSTFNTDVSPNVGLDTEFTNSPNSDYSLFLDLKQRAGMVKALAIIDFCISLYGLLFRMWWMSFSILFAPVGFYGAHKFKSRYVLIYMGYLVIDMLLEFILMFVYGEQLSIVMTIMVIAIQCFIEFYAWNLYKRLPMDGSPQYEQIIIQSGSDVPLRSVANTGV